MLRNDGPVTQQEPERQDVDEDPVRRAPDGPSDPPAEPSEPLNPA